jgi:voltage-gated potassium channel
MKMDLPFFRVLLVGLIAYLFLDPILSEAGKGSITMLFLTGLLVAAAPVLWGKPWRSFPRLAALGLVVVGIWLGARFGSNPLSAMATLTFVVAFLATTARLLLHVARTDHIAEDTLSAAVCGYILLGIAFGLAFGVLELLAPGSVSGATPIPARPRGELTYYSFVTLATLGFGELTPISSFARSLTILEAICGQFYIAAVVARIVGLQINKAR